jgi:hypothetical protein
MKLWGKRSKLVFHTEIDDVRSPVCTVELPNQPLTHCQEQIMKAIGDALSEMRKAQHKRPGRTPRELIV